MPRRSIGTILAAGLLAAGCAGGGGAPDAGWAAMLAMVPDTPSNRAAVFMEDVAAVRDLLDVTVPADDAGDDAVTEYLLTVTQGPVVDETTTPVTRSPRVFLGFPAFSTSQGLAGAIDVPGWRAELGIAITDVDADLSAGAPPDGIDLWIGSIDPDRVSEAVESDPVWSDVLDPWAREGLDAWCWGNDPAAFDGDRRTSVRPLGRGGCLAAFDGAAYRTITQEAMEGALDARAGAVRTLADVEALRLAAEALSAEGTYAAFVGADPGIFEALDAGADPAGTGNLLGPYAALGTGAGLDADGEYLVLVFVHDSADEAAANAATLEEIFLEGTSGFDGRPWSDLGTLRSVETDGRVVVAVAGGWGLARLWYQLPLNPDTLVVWR